MLKLRPKLKVGARLTLICQKEILFSDVTQKWSAVTQIKVSTYLYNISTNLDFFLHSSDSTNNAFRTGM